MKNKTIIISLVVFSIFLHKVVLAQSSGLSPSKAKTLNNKDWQQTIEAIRKDTKALLDQNENINSEYTFLKNKLSELKDGVSTLKKEIISQEDENRKLKDYRLEQQRTIGDSRQQLQRGEKDVRAAEAGKEDLLKQLSIVEQKTKLQQDKLDSLQAQKRELTLDLKMQEYYRADLKSGETDEIKMLKQQLQRLQKEEERLAQVAKNLQEKRTAIPENIKVLKMENKHLESEIALIEKQKKEKVQENDRAVKENKRLADLSTTVPPDLIKKKKVLNDITQIEKKLVSVKKQVAESSSVIEEKRSLMDEIMGMDAENQKMREQIAKTLKEITALKEEISALGGK